MEEINLFQNGACAQYEPQYKLIYIFQDVIHIGKRKEGLNLENTSWARLVVASIVVFLYCQILNNLYNNINDDNRLVSMVIKLLVALKNFYELIIENT